MGPSCFAKLYTGHEVEGHVQINGRAAQLMGNGGRQADPSPQSCQGSLELNHKAALVSGGGVRWGQLNTVEQILAEWVGWKHKIILVAVLMLAYFTSLLSKKKSTKKTGISSLCIYEVVKVRGWFTIQHRYFGHCSPWWPHPWIV